jgi:hypothetical protein
MTTLTDPAPYLEVLDRVDHVRARIRTLNLLEGLLAAAAIMGGLLLAVTVLQGYLRFGAAGRLVLLATGAATAVGVFWRCLILPVRYDPSDKEIARLIEMRLPVLGNSLINTLLLAEHADEWSPVLVNMAIRQAAGGARGVDLMEAVSDRKARRWGIAAAIALTLLGAWVTLGYGRFSSAAMQILMPFSRVASVGDVKILSVTPGAAAWIKGEPMEIEAVIADPGGRKHEGAIDITPASGAAARHEGMLRSAQRLDRFQYRIPQVLEPFEYRLSVGGTETQVFAVTLKEPALVERIDVTYHYPAYTGLEPQTVENNGGEIRCLIGTTVELVAHVSASVEAGNLVFGGGKTLGCLAVEGKKAVSARFTVLANDTYGIHLNGQAPGGAAVAYRIFALEDQPPVVQFTVPGRDTVAGLGEAVKLSLKASDRFGLGEVRLMCQAPGEEQPRLVQTWKKFADPKDAVLDASLTLDAPQYKLGQTVTYWAQALDRREYQGGDTPRDPNMASTAKYKIVLEDRKAAADQRLAQLSELYDRLRQILVSQQQARTTTSTVAAMQKLDEVRANGFTLAQAQGSIREATVRVVSEVTFGPDTLAIKETLQMLTANEMASAIAKAKAVGDADAVRLAAVGDLAAALAGDQDTIISVLRRILDIVPKLADAVKEEQNRLSPSDLPPDALDKLKALRDRLKEFVDEQKKVIEGSKELAKRPVDDFQEADQRELEKLKAIEDQWDKFLTEAIADFSKVPAVDASNPSLIKELIEVKTDVEMAADALAKKAMDVVVPLEELGMEAAEEIVENLERWLPDTPDREKWSQEEFTGDVEIPHAELPEQMEDLVGDLLEQEEDLFEEMEDVTSGAADSPDKGAGWDAMDGPISSFAAKGVTGNRLPNTSEISGRSGEGRSGKSSGEFVEEEATGKGGRRTPTRLSPDAFSKGDVKDSSPEAPGGATGGGKISGAGSEGLEGPVPPDVQRRMGSMAGKQAQLRNKAEGVRAALQVRNYDSFALDQAIDGMRRVQRDILAGRYQSALRQRDVVLESLKDTKMLLSGEVRIRQDSSAALPNEVQKDVLDALEKPMPRGYEEYLKRYYERLSEGS